MEPLTDSVRNRQSKPTGKRETRRSHRMSRIGRQEKATALGGSSLYHVVSAPHPPARGVNCTRLVRLSVHECTVKCTRTKMYRRGH